MTQLLQPLVQTQQLVSNLEGQSTDTRGERGSSLGREDLTQTRRERWSSVEGPHNHSYLLHLLEHTHAGKAVAHLVDAKKLLNPVSTFLLCVLESQLADKVTNLFTIPTLYTGCERGVLSYCRLTVGLRTLGVRK